MAENIANLLILNGSAYGIRTRVTAVRGRRPGPLDECAGVGGSARLAAANSRCQARLTRCSTSAFRPLHRRRCQPLRDDGRDYDQGQHERTTDQNAGPKQHEPAALDDTRFRLNPKLVGAADTRTVILSLAKDAKRRSAAKDALPTCTWVGSPFAVHSRLRMTDLCSLGAGVWRINFGDVASAPGRASR